MKKADFRRALRRAAAAGVIAVSVGAIGCAAGASLFFSPEFEHNGNAVKVETTAGRYEDVTVDVNKRTASGVVNIDSHAQGFITQSGMVVDFNGHAELSHNPAMGNIGTEQAKYIVTDGVGTYHAEGGSKVSQMFKAPLREIHLPLTDEDDPSTERDETKQILTGRAAGERIVTGDERKFPGDGTYDYTVHTVSQQGKLALEMQTVEVTEHQGVMEHGGMTHVRSTLEGSAGDADGSNVLPGGSISIPQNKNEVPAIAPGYEYIHLGSKVNSRFWLAYAYTEKISSFASETPVATFETEGKTTNLYLQRKHSDFNKMQVPRIYAKDKTIEQQVGAWYDSVQQFTLSDANANIVTAYCADQKTTAVYDYSYIMKNVQDADYYSEEEANMIRTVARNGYWGAASGTGSMASFKKMLKASGKFTQAEIDAVTPGIAMTATQYSIWTFSNVMNKMMFINAYDATVPGQYGRPGASAPKESADLLFKVYFHMLSLPPTEISEISKTTGNTIINEKNFVKDVVFKFTDKPMTHPNNRDAETGNDVYTAELSFVLHVSPNAKKDDLVLVIKDKGEDGKVYARGRVAGTLKPGEVQLKKGPGNRYTFEAIDFVEGAKNLTFVMTGTQELEQDAYLYTSEIKNGEPSQTMVGIASGKRQVAVSLDMLFVIDVDDELSTVERYWRSEKGIPNPRPPHGGMDVPKTGDDSMLVLWAALMLVGCTGLVWRRKRSA